MQLAASELHPSRAPPSHVHMLLPTKDVVVHVCAKGSVLFRHQTDTSFQVVQSYKARTNWHGCKLPQQRQQLLLQLLLQLLPLLPPLPPPGPTQ